MAKKAIPNGDLDFATMAQAFARNVMADPGRFEIAPGDAEQLGLAVDLGELRGGLHHRGKHFAFVMVVERGEVHVRPAVGN